MNLKVVRAKKMQVSVLKLRCARDGVMAGLLLVLLFWGGLLLQCGDVELNPGPVPPTKTDNMRQTRLNSAARSASADRGATPSDTSAKSRPGSEEPTIVDVMAMLQEMSRTNKNMDSKLDDVKKDVKALGEQYDALRDEVRSLRGEVEELRNQNDNLGKVNSELCEKMESLERKTDDLEGRSRRSNLLFYGVVRKDSETSDDCVKVVEELVADKMGVQGVEFDRAHRLNAKRDSPIIVKCTYYRDKLSIMKAKLKLKGTNVFVGEDFTSRVREIRRKLTPHLKEARNRGQRVAMVFDHLLIEGKKFGLNESGGLKELR